MTNYVYFMRAEQYIKIGTSRHPMSRLRQLRSPVSGGCVPTDLDRPALHLVASVHGDHRRERTIQKQFEHLRVAGEWFQAAPELLDFIASATEDAA